MLAASNPDRIGIAFDDDRLVDHAGLRLPATLAGGMFRRLASVWRWMTPARARASTVRADARLPWTAMMRKHIPLRAGSSTGTASTTIAIPTCAPTTS